MKLLAKDLLKWLQNISPVKYFVVTTSIFGLVFVIITPPFQTPDEPMHFYRTYQISTLNFVPDFIDGVLWGGKLPKSIDETVVLVNTPQINFKSQERYDLSKTKKAFSIRTLNDKTEYYQTSSAIFTPVMYIPQTIAVVIGRIFAAPPILLMYLARIAMLVTWIGIFSLAVELMPYKKWALVAIGLLPMTLFQAISLGGDAIIIGLGALYFAYILRIKYLQKAINNRQILVLTTISTLMVLGKAVMITLVPLTLLIAFSQSQGKRRSLDLRVLFTLIVPILFYLLWLYVIRDVNTHPSELLPNGANATEQLRVLLHSPLTFISALWNMYILSWGDHIVRSNIGSFGWMDTPLPESTTVVGYLGLGFLIIANASSTLKTKLSNREKVFIGALFISYWFLVNVAMYLSNTTVGIKLIYGVQGRYFLPLIILLIPLLQSSWLRSSKGAYRQIAIFLPLFLLVSSTITLLFRYYIESI